MGSGGTTALLSPGRGWRVASFGKAAPRSQGGGEEGHERLLQALDVLRPRVSFDESKKLEVIWSSHTDH